ncbi:cell division protein ZapA [Exiguobacterium flavidum]|uniref:cell division protein ZapA n=1 Tax=Exiguobacterium flavidum TaxID=2184695 RepID=UPI000DF817F9|nr:cell division protein ZapA [Exiguobacterium flavidum]
MADSEALNRTTIHIAGSDYTIVGTESPEHVREVGLLVDTKIREIRDQAPQLDVRQIAVLAALNIGSDYLKIKKNLGDA